MTANSFTIVRPIVPDASMLVSTNVPEDDHAAWSNAATYAKGDRVIVLSTHSVYESLVDSNTGADPTVPAAEPKWLRVGATNRWRAYDKSVTSQTRHAGMISYRFKFGRAVNTLAIFNLIGATSARVRVIDPVYGDMYDKKIALGRTPSAIGWWSWYYGERRAPVKAVFEDFPALPTADVIIEIEGTVELAVGEIVIGPARKFSLGVTLGARVGTRDYSTKETDRFGNTVLVELPYADRASFPMLLQWGEVDAFKNYLDTVRAVPCLFIGTKQFNSTTIYGFFTSFEIVIDYHNYADCDIDIEGLT